jgi:hypothetical protein
MERMVLGKTELSQMLLSARFLEYKEIFPVGNISIEVSDLLDFEP